MPFMTNEKGQLTHVSADALTINYEIRVDMDCVIFYRTAKGMHSEEVGYINLQDYRDKQLFRLQDQARHWGSISDGKLAISIARDELTDLGLI